MYGPLGPRHTGIPRDLCDTLFDRAAATWHQLDWGSRFDILPGEETITDNNLLDIQLRHHTHIRTWKLTRQEERQMGADWEWWFGGRAGWFGLRVQAKKLYPGSSKYESLKVKQADELIRHSLPYGISAFYCFYNSSWPMRSGHPSVGACCSNHRHQEAFGCTLVPAFEVYNRVSAGQKRLTDFESVSVPWQCLLCCPRFQRRDSSLPQRVKAVAVGLDSFGSAALREQPLQEQPPEYVVDVFAGRDPTVNLMSSDAQDWETDDQDAQASAQPRYVSVVLDPEWWDGSEDRFRVGSRPG